MIFNKLLSAATQSQVVEFAYQTSNSIDRASSTTSFTFTSQSIGVANANRVIIVCVSGFRAGATLGTLTGVSIGGITATRIYNSLFTASSRSSIWAAVVPSGTTATVVVSHGAATTCGISIYRLVTLNGSIPTIFSTSEQFFNPGTSIGDFPNTPPTTSPTNGSIGTARGSAVLSFYATVEGVNPTWTGLTKDVGRDTRSNEWISSASSYPTGAGIINYSATNATGTTVSLSIVTLCLV